MSESNQDQSIEGGDVSNAVVVSAMDVLIGRVIDGEAAPSERERFERLASDDPSLWRRLALRQQDMATLAAHVEPVLDAAERVELPASRVRAWPWWVGASGWAAVLGLAAMWVASDRMGGSEHTARSLPADARIPLALTPEQHLQLYKQAPFVLGEMQPTLLNIESLPDGRFAMSYLRRLVEVSFFDSESDIPVDAEGNLVASPHNLQTLAPPGSRSED